MKKKFTLVQIENLGHSLGASLRGGECIELVGDVGAGKTTLTKHIARGLEIDEDVQSPSFTISRTYSARDGLELNHYDFYRLDDPGIMRYELAESLDAPTVVTVIEWGESVKDILPDQRVTIHITHDEERQSRQLDIVIPEQLDYLEEGVDA